MLNFIIRYRIRTNRGSGITTGHFINVYWDDVAEAIEVQDFDNDADTTGTVLTSGPDLGADRIDHEPVSTVTPIPFSFCDGTDLQTFSRSSLFPYVIKKSTPNHFSCVSLVCDLQISDTFTMQTASDSTTPDGVIEVTATSSNGEIKYSLDPDFNYASEGQLTGIFPGLYAGSYTITAKDELGCVDQITITVTVPDFYNPLYRLDYKDLNGIDTRVDILERGYLGSVIEVKGDRDPFILKYNGDGEIDKFTPIIPSEARITLISESNFYFRELFTQDERKYQVRYYKDRGTSTVGFTPAVLPSYTGWTNVDYAGPIFAGLSWNYVGGSNVVVGIGSFSFPRQSDFWYSPYTFQEGQLYKFGYSILTGTAGGPSDVSGSVALIQIHGASNVVLTEKIVSLTANTTTTGEYEFIAPSGAVGVAVQIKAKATAFDVDFTLNSFTNLTASVVGGSSGYELKWLGYLISSNFSEPYTRPPYPVSLVATDGLADLKNYDFVDKDGNKYREDLITLQAINEILAKTELKINVQSAINRYEVEMDTSSIDDPLNQCEFNPETFYHGNTISNCYDVLSEIIKPFGARILQRNGKWCIYSIEEFVDDANYREFNTESLLVSNGTFDEIVDIDKPIISTRAAFQNMDQVLAMIPSYGKMFFEHTLLKWDSLVKSYSFEPDDIYTSPTGQKLFKNWNVNIINFPGATYGIKETKSFEGDYNFYVKYQINRGGVGSSLVPSGISLLSSAVNIEYEAVDAFEYRFNYACLIAPGSFGNVFWIKLKWMLKVGAYYYNENGGWTTDSNQRYNEIIIERFNEVTEKKVTALFREVTALTSESAEVEFILNNAYVYDFADITALKATPTTTKAIGAQMKVASSTTALRYYTLREGTDAESLPNIVRPTDYAGTTNERVWELDFTASARAREVEYNFIDNVVLLHFPDAVQPPENITIQRNNNAGIKVNFEKSYLLNDIDIDNINNSERTYKNYFKLLDGTPTQVWERTYRPGSGKLLDLLSNDVVSQYKRGSNKLTGSFLIDREVLPTSVMKEVHDDGRKYMFMGYELHDKHASIVFDLLELQDTITDDESEEIDAGFTTGFSLGFRS